MDEKEVITEEEGSAVNGATQPSDVDGGKVSVFGSNGGNELKVKDSEDFYKKLLQLEDYKD